MNRRRSDFRPRSLDGMRAPSSNLGEYNVRRDLEAPRKSLEERSADQIDFDQQDIEADPVADAPEPESLNIDIDEEEESPKRKRRFMSLKFVKRSGKILAALVVVAGLAFAIQLYLTSSKIIVRSNGEGAAALQDDFDITKLKGEGDGRVNILIIGIGGEGHTAGNLADSIILASIDPFAHEVTMLSVPRDLYVAIPGYGSTRINAAHVYGEEYGYEGGGPGLLIDTLEDVLDVPIHYYVRADFEGFKQAVDIVGGVDVNVEESIYDYSYPADNLRGYEPFIIEAGQHHLDGREALKYARSRYSTSDFDRSRRQQQMLVAIKDKALSASTLTQPQKISGLMSTAADHVQTDLSLDEIRKLIEISSEVDSSRVTHAQLDNSADNYLASSNVGGASVLVPRAGDFSEVQAYVRRLLVDGFVKKEAASVVVLNGTDQPGLATTVSDILKDYGYNVVNVDNDVRDDHEVTQIIDYSDGTKPVTIRYLEQRFGVKAERFKRPEGQSHDITVIVGLDYNP